MKKSDVVPVHQISDVVPVHRISDVVPVHRISDVVPGSDSTGTPDIGCSTSTPDIVPVHWISDVIPVHRISHFSIILLYILITFKNLSMRIVSYKHNYFYSICDIGARNRKKVSL